MHWLVSRPCYTEDILVLIQMQITALEVYFLFILCPYYKFNISAIIHKPHDEVKLFIGQNHEMCQDYISGIL